MGFHQDELKGIPWMKNFVNETELKEGKKRISDEDFSFTYGCTG